MKTDVPEFSQPEITMTEVGDGGDQLGDGSDAELGKQYSTESMNQSFSSNGMKRVNSVNSLTIPGNNLFLNLKYFSFLLI